MIAPGAFGHSKYNRMNSQPVLSEEGIQKASRNRKIFNRAIFLVMQEHGKTRNEVLEWLDDDQNDCWVAHNEANPHNQI